MTRRRVMLFGHRSLAVCSGEVVGRYRQMVVVQLDHHCGTVYMYPHEVQDDMLPQWLPEWLRRWVYELKYRRARHGNRHSVPRKA